MSIPPLFALWKAVAVAVCSLAVVASVVAGPIIEDRSAKVETKPERNPLAFWDGKLVFDLQERLRFEARDNNFDFNDSVNAITDDSWLLQRVRVGALVKPLPWLKFYTQGQDAREIGSKRADIPGLLGAEGDDAFDLRQAWIEVGDPKSTGVPLTLKLGRQTLAFGDERLVGLSDWNNFGRTFDAVKLRYESKSFALDAFAATVVVPDRGSFNQSDLFNGTERFHDVLFSGTTGPTSGTNSISNQIFSGLYATTSLLPFQTTDAYLLYLHQDNRVLTTGVLSTPTTSFATLGVRFKSVPEKLPESVNGFEYDLETAFQVGEVRSLDLLSYAFHGGVGYTFGGVPWSPRLYAEYNFATGDHNPNDGDIQTFQNLFPTNHKFYGALDFFAWENVHNPELSLRLTPIEKKLTLSADYHAFFLADTNDRIYRANGVIPLRPLTPRARTAGSYAGSEVDLRAVYTPIKPLSFEVGYSHFFNGDYLKTAPSSAALGARPFGDDADFVYVMTTISF